MEWGRRAKLILVSIVGSVSISGTPISAAPDVAQPTASSTVEQASQQQTVKPSVRHRLVKKFDASRSRVKQRAIVKQYAYWYATKKLGLSEAEFWMVHEIWERESHWNWDALGMKQSDGRAKGIPQVKWSKMIRSPFRQVEKGFDYLLTRYGSVQAAYEFHMKNGWY